MFRMIAFGGAGLGTLLVAGAVIGRFWSTPRITMLGHTMEAGTLLTVANTCFLVGIFCLLAGGKKGS